MTDLLKPLGNYGMKCEIVSFSHLDDLEQEYFTALRKFNFSDDVYGRNLLTLIFRNN